MKTTRRVILACAVLVLLAACGNKGALVMPDKPAAQPEAPAPEAGNAGEPVTQP
ncbi:MAG: lipoprotein [Thermomonas sp.]|uniref:LPS translocon maturation chaperone LptM n=1 Tax=Thermomonas sp. TaxID=1971895 RepID=UPI0039E50FB2